jgi:hypothetical protein
MIHVYTDNGETVYYTEGIEYVSETVPVYNTETMEPVVVILVQFTPKNGPARGLVQRIPISKVSNIVDARTADDEGQAEENAAIALSIRVQAFRNEIEKGQLDEYLDQLTSSVAYRRSQVEPRASRR